MSISIPCSVSADLNGLGFEDTRLKAAQVRQLYAQSRAGVITGLGVSILVVAALWQDVPRPWLLAWISVFFGTQGPRLYLIQRFQRMQGFLDDQAVLRYGRWFLVGSVLSSMYWGFGSAALVSFGDAPHRFLPLAVVVGVGAAMAWTHAPLEECVTSSVVLTVGPLCVRLLSEGNALSIMLGFAGLMYIATLLSTASAARALHNEAIKLRLERERLLERIDRSNADTERALVEKEAALSARNEELERQVAELAAVHEAKTGLAEQLKRAQHLACVGSWELDLNDRELTWSPEMFRILEEDPNTCKPSPTTLFRRAHPEDAEYAVAKHQESQAYAEPSVTEYRLIMPDGRVKSVQSRYEFLRDANGQPLRALGTLQDVTERRTAETSLVLTRFALDHVMDGAFLTDEQSRFLYANEAACRIFGCTKQEALDTSLIQIDPNFPLDVWQSQWAKLKQEKSLTFEVVHRTLNESKCPVEISATYFVYKNTPYCWAFVRDVTERNRIQEDRLAWERRHLEAQKLESLGALAGGIAHDFNNLLTAVLGNMELALADPSISATARIRLQRAVAASQRAVAITRQMLAYSGKGKFVLAKLSLSELVENDRRLLTDALSPSVELSLDLDRSLPQIEGDPLQIRQLVTNLITNACEAAHESGNAVHVVTGVMHCDDVCLSKSRLDHKPHPGLFAFLQVSDRGQGMDEHTLQKLFDPFFSTKFMGRGLGMSAVMGIVRGHGGAILVDSAVGKGTTVRVLFPVRDSLEEQVSHELISIGEQDAPSPHDQGRRTVLIVDDEEIIRDVSRDMLEYVGFRVLCASDGFEGLEVFKQHACTVDCILLDLSMPRMDGLTALESIQQIRSDVKVILSSGFDTREAAQRFTGRGLAGFLQKPYQMQTLISRLNEIMESHT